MRKLILAPLALLGAALAMPVLAQTPHEGGHEGGHMPFMHALHQVGLTDAQKTSIHQLMENHKADFTKAHESESQIHQSLMTLDPSASNYDSQVSELAQQGATLATQHVQLMATIKREIYAVLTDAQKTQLNGILANMAKEHEQAPAGSAQ
jgi:Spy/CpxP family protein refolding chaperone